MSGDMLGARECGLTDGAGVVSGHCVEGNTVERTREWRELMGLGEWPAGSSCGVWVGHLCHVDAPSIERSCRSGSPQHSVCDRR